MPYISIRITEENVTSQQKREMIKGATALMVNILNKKPEFTHVVIDEVNPENWGLNNEQYSETLKLK